MISTWKGTENLQDPIGLLEEWLQCVWMMFKRQEMGADLQHLTIVVTHRTVTMGQNQCVLSLSLSPSPPLPPWVCVCVYVLYMCVQGSEVNFTSSGIFYTIFYNSALPHLAFHSLQDLNSGPKLDPKLRASSLHGQHFTSRPFSPVPSLRTSSGLVIQGCKERRKERGCPAPVSDLQVTVVLVHRSKPGKRW